MRKAMMGTANRLERRWTKIRAKMEKYAAILTRQGSIASQKSGSKRRWTLRFVISLQDRSVQRAIYIGSEDQPELLKQARQLLALYRMRARWPKEVANFAKFAAQTIRLIRRSVDSADIRRRQDS